MLSRAKDLRDASSEWPDSLYGRFNFHRDEHIDALVERLLDNDLPAVVVLGGEPGIGRGFLCDAAVRRARDQGHQVAVWHLDLDGFEPDAEDPLTRFLGHLIDRAGARRAERPAAGTLSALDLGGPASERAASLLSLLWQLDAPPAHAAELLSRPPNGDGEPPRDDPGTLHRVVAELTRDRRLLVHVKDGAELTTAFRLWLLREAEQAAGRLLLVISCPLDQATEDAAPEARSTPGRFDLPPLDRDELYDRIDRCFEPNKLPDELLDELLRRSRGRPAAVANQLADLMEAGLLAAENGTWRLPPAGMKDPRLVKALSQELYDEVDTPLTTLAEEEPELARVLLDLLPLLALCGRYVPLAMLLEHMDLDENTAEAAVDWVDDVLVGELGWLTDLGFQTAGFPGHDVYAFTHPLLPQVILDQEPEGSREYWATNLLPFLEQRVPFTTRGWTRCLLSIAENLEGREREPFERRLSWWVGARGAAALQSEIRTAIEQEEIEPELVWQTAEASNAWPAWRRLAVLDAYAEATSGEGAAAIAVMPFDRLADFHLLRAEILLEAGRPAESMAGVLNALKVISQEPLHDLETAMAPDRPYDAGAVAAWIARLREILGRDEATIPAAELRQIRQDLLGLLVEGRPLP